MKLSRIILATSIAALTASASATTYSWQTAGENNAWDLAGNNWWIGAGTTLSPWADGNDAVFAGATGETVTIVDVLAPTTTTIGAGHGTWTLDNSGTGSVGGALTKTGNGTLTLTGTTANAFTSTTIHGGVLSLGTGSTVGPTSNVGALGTGPVTVNAGGTLRYWIQNNAAFTLANDVTLNGGTLLSEDGNNMQGGAVALGTAGGTIQSTWNDKTFTVAGIISGNGRLTVSTGPTASASGANTVLSGNNTFTGGTRIASGTVRVATNNTALGTGNVVFTGNSRLGTFATGGGRVLSNAITIRPSVVATMDAVSGANLRLNGVISGTGSIVKTGAADLSLGGANTFTGGLTLSGGTLRVATTDLALGSGGVIVTANSTVATENGGGARTLANPFTINSGVTMNADGGYATLIFAGPITGAGNVARASTGTVVLAGNNTYTGTTNAGTAAGVLQIGTGGGSGTLGTGDVATTAGGILIFNRGNGYAVSNVISGTGEVRIGGRGTTTLAGNSTYTGTTSVNAGTLNLTGTLTSDILANSGGRISGTGSTSSNLFVNPGGGIVAGTNTIKANNVYLLTGTSIFVAGTPTGTPVTVDVVRYDGAASFDAVATYRGGLLTDDTLNKKVTLAYTAEAKTWNTTTGVWDTGVSANFSGGSDSFFFWGDSVAFNNPAAIATVSIDGTVAPSAITVNNTNAYTFSPVTGVASIAGTGSLTKSGNGTLTLGALSNTYSGGTIINGGVLALGVGGTGAVTSSVNALGTGAVTVNTGGTLKLWIQNSTTFTIGNDLNFDGGRLLGEDGNYILNGNVSLLSGGLSVGTKWDGKTVNIAGTISGPGALNVIGEGGGSAANAKVVILSGANTYTGATNVTSGTLRVAHGLALGDTVGETVVTSGMRLELTSNVVVPGETVTIAGGGGNNFGALQSQSGVNTWGGTIKLGAAAAGDAGPRVGALGNTGLRLTGNIQDGVTSNLVINSSNVSGVLGVVSVGGAAKTYTGSTQLLVGTLRLEDNNVLPAGSLFRQGTATAGEDSTFDLAGYSQTLAGLETVAAASPGRISNSWDTPSTLTVNPVGTRVYAGVIENGVGGLALIKNGTGIQTLGGINTYSGATTVNGGTLAITGSLTASSVTVNSGGTLGGTGTVGSVTIASGGTLLGGTEGSTAGSLTLTGNVTFQDSSVIRLTLGAAGAHSTLTSTGGAWSFDTDQAFSFASAGLTVGTYQDIITGLVADPGTTGQWQFADAGFAGSFSYDGSGHVDLNLTAVPEPGSAALLLGGLAMTMGLRRRRSAK